jgi:hypothetical protein
VVVARIVDHVNFRFRVGVEEFEENSVGVRSPESIVEGAVLCLATKYDVWAPDAGSQDCDLKVCALYSMSVALRGC